MTEMEAARVRPIVEALLKYAEQHTCRHEETHRGGVLWEICNLCDAKWADDEGGKPEWVEPEALLDAYDLLNDLTRAAQGWRDYDGRVYVLPGGKTGFAPMPIRAGTRVAIRYRDGDEIETSQPEQMRWGWTRPYVAAADIVAYRVLP